MRQLDPNMQAALSAGVIVPALLCQLTFTSGTQYIWSGIGDLVWNGNTYTGVGTLGSVGAITEGTTVRANGTTVTLSGIDATLYGDCMSDIQLGATAKLWFALLSPGLAPNLIETSVFNNGTGNWGRSTVPVTGQPFTNALTTNTRDTVEVGNIFTVTPGEQLFVSGYINTQSDADTATIGVFFPQAPTWIPAFTLNAGTDWTYGSGWVTVPGGCTQAQPWLQINEANDDTSQTALFALPYISTAPPQAVIIGTPYMIFSGMVDQPEVSEGGDTISLTLNLETRLTNLQRPNMRRYTSADQRLLYPTDNSMQWVEQLNDVALIWGT